MTMILRVAASKPEPVETFTNEEDQMESYVFKNQNGKYNVTLRDLDSGSIVPIGFTDIPSLSQAVAKAKKIVG